MPRHRAAAAADRVIDNGGDILSAIVAGASAGVRSCSRRVDRRRHHATCRSSPLAKLLRSMSSRIKPCHGRFLNKSRNE
jgi:hypothetical protein